jgi:putative endopeptidase
VEKTGSLLEEEFQYIPWSIFFETLGLSSWKSTLFFIDSTRWLHTVNKLFHHLGLDQWKLLFSLEFLLYSLTWLPPPSSDISFRFYRKLLRGQQKKLDRSVQAVYVAQQYAMPFFSKLYKEQYINPSLKPSIESIIQELLHVAEKRLESVEWLEPSTRKKAQEKIHAMKFIVAYPDEFEHHVLPHVDDTHLLTNLLELGEWQTQYELKKLGQPISQRKEWDDALFAVNAYYYEQANEMVIPSGILNPPFYDEKKSWWNKEHLQIDHEESYQKSNRTIQNALLIIGTLYLLIRSQKS